MALLGRPEPSVGRGSGAGQDRLWGRRSIAQGTVWSDRVVVMPPLLDEHLGLLQGIEDLSIEQLVAELAVEALVVSVLPGAAGLDIEGLDADPAEPGPYRIGSELSPIVGADMIGWPMTDKELAQAVQDIIRVQSPGQRPFRS